MPGGGSSLHTESPQGNMKFSLTFAVLTLLAVGCANKNKATASAEDARQFRETKINLEACNQASSTADPIDANGDGKPEIVRVLKGKNEVCRTVDLNFDGRIDRTIFFDEAGKERRTESDFDRDGIVDEIAIFKSGVISEKWRMTTMDGKLDTWEFFENGALVRTERDENGDGVIDQWWEYPSKGCPLIHVDADGDGRPDPGASIDYCKETGYSPPPLPGDETKPSGPTDFGETERVEELSNQKADSNEDASDETKADAPTKTEGAE